MPEYAVISCGQAKAPRPAPAYRLYTGAFFRGQWAWASALYPPARIRILSAKYGLVTPMTRLDPYDLRMGAAGSVDAATVTAGLPDDCTGIVSSVGSDYARVLDEAAAARGIAVTYPFNGGIGVRLGQMARARRRAGGPTR